MRISIDDSQDVRLRSPSDQNLETAGSLGGCFALLFSLLRHGRLTVAAGARMGFAFVDISMFVKSKPHRKIEAAI